MGGDTLWEMPVQLLPSAPGPSQLQAAVDQWTRGTDGRTRKLGDTATGRARHGARVASRIWPGRRWSVTVPVKSEVGRQGWRGPGRRASLTWGRRGRAQSPETQRRAPSVLPHSPGSLTRVLTTKGQVQGKRIPPRWAQLCSLTTVQDLHCCPGPGRRDTGDQEVLPQDSLMGAGRHIDSGV